jgi:hypothetical protein
MLPVAACGITTADGTREAMDNAPRLAWVSGIGLVFGKPVDLATLFHPLEPKPGPNRVVEPCRTAIREAASRLGAVAVEAISAGPERSADGRAYEGPVEARIIYEGLLIYEVRRATVICRLDEAGMVTDVAEEPTYWVDAACDQSAEELNQLASARGLRQLYPSKFTCRPQRMPIVGVAVTGEHSR